VEAPLTYNVPSRDHKKDYDGPSSRRNVHRREITLGELEASEGAVRERYLLLMRKGTLHIVPPTAGKLKGGRVNT